MYSLAPGEEIEDVVEYGGPMRAGHLRLTAEFCDVDHTEAQVEFTVGDR